MDSNWFYLGSKSDLSSKFAAQVTILSRINPIPSSCQALTGAQHPVQLLLSLHPLFDTFRSLLGVPRDSPEGSLVSLTTTSRVVSPQLPCMVRCDLEIFQDLFFGNLFSTPISFFLPILEGLCSVFARHGVLDNVG